MHHNGASLAKICIPKDLAMVNKKRGRSVFMKKLILVAVTVFIGNICAQDTESIIVKYDNDGNVAWEKNLEENGVDYSSITAVSDGFVVVGNSSKEDYGSSAIIVKYGNDGNVAWKKNFSEIGYDINKYVSVTAVSDGLVVVGESEDGGDGISIIMKYGNKGNVVWKEYSKCFGSCNSITTVSGGVVAVGRRYPDAIIIKHDNKGNVVWEKKKNFGGKDEKYSSVTAVSDGVVAVGESSSFDGAAIVKYSNNGNVAWEKNLGGSGWRRYASVIAVSNGVVAIGRSKKNNIIVKYDNNGNVAWEKNLAEIDNYSVTAVPDGVVLLKRSNNNTIIVKYDNNGNVAWEKNLGKNVNYHLLTAVSDGFVVVGNKIRVEASTQDAQPITTAATNVVKRDVLTNGSVSGIGTKARGGLRAPSSHDINMGGDDSRSKAEIMAVVNSRMPGLRNIYNKHLKLKPGFSGKVTLKFTIAAGGDITSISIVESTTDYPEFDRAIKNMVATWKWKTIKSGSTTPTIPFIFE
jgi:TonB family protein